MQVIIPIGNGSNWQNNELRYCLRSLQENCKFDFDVTVISEPNCYPDWLTNVEHIEIPRYYPEGLEDDYGAKFYECYFSNLNKYFEYSNSSACPDKFAVVYDDQLLLKPIDSFDCFENVALCPDKSNQFDKKKRTRHEKTILKALDLAHMDRHTDNLYNYATHCIKVYERERLQKLFRKFPYQKMKIPYDLATLYFNIYYDHPKLVLRDATCSTIAYLHFEDGYHHFDAITSPELDNIAKRYTMISYNDRGLLPGVKNWIENRWPYKSKYEI
jgi:hypothetical protein